VREERNPTSRTPAPPGADRAVRDADPSLREIGVETILAGRREAVLVHNGVRYRLRITSNDKLILTK
jgi:hemin uptake protein HemP